MATAVIMPRQGQSVESCIIAKWHKQKGDKVAVGDLLFTYETDKATFEEEAKVEGTLLDIFFVEGDDVECLLNVCAIGNEGEDVSDLNPNKAEAQPAQAEAPAENKTEASTPAQTSSAVQVAPAQQTDSVQQAAPAQRAEGEFIKISPRARGLAEKSGADVAQAPATGPNGRIIERDIQTLIANHQFATPAASAEFAGSGLTSGTGLGGRVTTADLANKPDTSVNVAPAVADYEEVAVPNIRKVIAKTMHASLSEMAQLTLNSSFDATDVLNFRKKLKESKDRLGLANITINDIVLYAVAKTLPNHKTVNAHFLGDKMLQFNNAHVGMAVDTDRGLLVPTLFNANHMSLNQIATLTKTLASEAQSGTISPDVLKGGTFTVTNLGTLGIESFTPVINPPQTCILGVDCMQTKIREAGGEIETYPAMGLSLTFDHRALDGAPAARFLKELVTNLENFSTLLAL